MSTRVEIYRKYILLFLGMTFFPIIPKNRCLLTASIKGCHFLKFIKSKAVVLNLF